MNRRFYSKISCWIFMVTCLTAMIKDAAGQDQTLPADSLNRWNATGSLVFTNNAFAPMPAFSFDDPAILAFASFSVKRFTYAPDFSIGFNGTPWMWNNWFQFVIAKNKESLVSIGINPGLFFKSDQLLSEETVVSSHRNLTGEIRYQYRLTSKVMTVFTYRYNEAFDKGTLNGHAFDLATTVREFVALKGFSLSTRPQVFYFTSEGIFKGFFIASSFTLSYRLLPVHISYQAVQSVWENYLHKPTYMSNISMIYIF